MPLKRGDMDHRQSSRGKWIQEVVESPSFHKGAFTRQAKSHGMTTKEFMEEVLSNPDKYDSHTKHRAQFMKNITHHS